MLETLYLLLCAMTTSQSETLCPFMVVIKQNVRGKVNLCGGTVLTETLTLTAAHCLVHGIIGLHLQFGSVYIFGGRSFEATKIVMHTNFDPLNLAHDIGTASIFPARIAFGYNVRPIVLPTTDISLDDRAQLRIYGWGAVSENTLFSEILQSADLPIVDSDICKSLLEKEVPMNTFCLGYPDGHVDACSGDSGGPAMLFGTQVGITSFGEGCAIPLKPGVYTDVRKYTNWLHLVIETVY